MVLVNAYVPTPADFIKGLEADGYDHAVDRTLPRSAINWPGWMILALRPRFALSFPAWSRTLAVLAFRSGFAIGLEELDHNHPSNLLTMTR